MNWGILRFALCDPVIIFFLHVTCEELGLNIELNGVVTSCDRLNIPLDIIVLLSLLDVVNIVDDKESDKSGKAAYEQTLLFSCDHFGILDNASDLKENLRGITITLCSVKISRVAHDVVV